MKIGLIVDGQAEYRSLSKIFPRINTNATLLTPYYADLQPHAAPAKIVRAAMPAIRILVRKKVDTVLVLLDHEGRQVCVPEWRNTLENTLRRPCREAGINNLHVVLKVQTYENWLVSDPKALKAIKQRFKLSKGNENLIAPNKADQADALRIIKQSTQKNAYNKVSDAIILMNRFDPYVGAENSRSFRRFLRLAGCNNYSEQSKTPVGL